MFHTVKNRLYCEGLSIEKLANEYGTPLYIYSKTLLEQNFRSFNLAFKRFPHIICYALKANSNLSVARTLSNLGAGADIVSGGELYRALKAGYNPKKIVFSGVGKTREEMRTALLKGILMFNVESIEELQTLNDVARSIKIKAPIALRVNPDVEAGTHHHITTGTAENKFGIHKNYIFTCYKLARTLKFIKIQGIQAHIGSQITEVKPFVTLLKTLLEFVDSLAKNGIPIHYLDVGGGLGISYNREVPPTPEELAQSYSKLLKGRELILLFEPGRFLVGPTGVLVTKVLYRKWSGHKTFVIVDGGMNDMARPALYDAYHEIVPVASEPREQKRVDVVGPVCESGDYFAKGRVIPFPHMGEFLVIKDCGAYGFSMSSQYNSRPRAAELLVEGEKGVLIRKRETFKDLIRDEQ